MASPKLVGTFGHSDRLRRFPGDFLLCGSRSDRVGNGAPGVMVFAGLRVEFKN